MATIAQSAFAQLPAASGLDLSAEIIVYTLYSHITEYQGTRAALEAEGVIPAGTQWPKDWDILRWKDGTFHYWLRRERPKGIKGSRQQLLNFDWWQFRFNPINAKSILDCNIELKAKELADMIHRQSPEGHAAWSKQFDRYCSAQQDEKFQAFKALIPGLVRPKCGRRPRTAVEQSGNA